MALLSSLHLGGPECSHQTMFQICPRPVHEERVGAHDYANKPTLPGPQSHYIFAFLFNPNERWMDSWLCSEMFLEQRIKVGQLWSAFEGLTIGWAHSRLLNGFLIIGRMKKITLFFFVGFERKGRLKSLEKLFFDDTLCLFFPNQKLFLTFATKNSRGYFGI